MKSAYHHGDLRAALLDTGLRLLAGRTVDDLSLREIAREVGVSATAVYRHFPDKAALRAALAKEGLARLAVAQRAAADKADAKDSFAATGRAYVRFALANPALFRLIFSSPAPGDLLRRPLEHGDEATSFLKANAARQAPAGADQDVVQAVALQAWSSAHGLAMLMLDGQVPADDSLIDRVLGEGGKSARRGPAA